MSTELIPAGDLFTQITAAIADPKSLTEEQLSQLADTESAMQAAYNKIKEEIQFRVDQGIVVPGWAMEPGNGKNVWNKDEEVVVKKLKACRLKDVDIYPKKMIGPAQLDALMKDGKLTDKQVKRLRDELVTYVGGKKSLKKVARTVAQSAPDVAQSAEMMFGAVVPPPSNDVSFF